MNINILQNGVNLLEKNENTSKGKIVISSDIKKYFEFCSTLILKRLIRVPIRVTFSTSILIEYILTSSSEKLSLSDHQRIFCTRKIERKNLKTSTIIVHFAL